LKTEQYGRRRIKRNRMSNRNERSIVEGGGIKGIRREN